MNPRLVREANSAHSTTAADLKFDAIHVLPAYHRVMTNQTDRILHVVALVGARERVH